VDDEINNGTPRGDAVVGVWDVWIYVYKINSKAPVREYYGALSIVKLYNTYNVFGMRQMPFLG
jgi:hypothetical protein